MKKVLLAALLVFLLAVAALWSQEPPTVYVGPGGSDSNDGLTLATRLRTWPGAVALYRRLHCTASEPFTVTDGARILLVDNGQPDTVAFDAGTGAAFQPPCDGSTVEAYNDGQRVHRPLFTRTRDLAGPHQPNIVWRTSTVGLGGRVNITLRGILVQDGIGASGVICGVNVLLDGLRIDRGAVGNVGQGNVSTLDLLCGQGPIAIVNSVIGGPYPIGGFGASGVDPLNWRAIQTDLGLRGVTLERSSILCHDGLTPVGFGTKRNTTQIRLASNEFLGCGAAGIEINSRSDGPPPGGPIEDVLIEQNVFIGPATANVGIATNQRRWGIWTSAGNVIRRMTVRNNTAVNVHGLLSALCTGTGDTVYPEPFRLYNNLVDIAGTETLAHVSWSNAFSTCLSPTTHFTASYNGYRQSARFLVNGASINTLGAWQRLSFLNGAPGPSLDLVGTLDGVDPLFVSSTPVLAEDVKLQAGSPYRVDGASPGRSDGTLAGSPVARGAYMRDTDVIGARLPSANLPPAPPTNLTIDFHP